MAYKQTVITLPAHHRGVHLITQYVAQAINELLSNTAVDSSAAGLVHLFLQHTSASLSINENADPDVRLDAEDWLNQVAPSNQPYYRHTLEGADDLPAHLKSMMLGVSLTLPLINGKLGLGVWQGIYLCEHRDHAGGRRIVVTVNT